ncbi:putative zinc finger protein [Rosellinia necatrix]|uniref:Putative zinc finger protein n=1 Tax=Rosellinia necatrix TaxID=77044 RepID=A0A1W2TLK8_ROSNE|nr:putative zinc finger protein [Rosellinia necatrix]
MKRSREPEEEYPEDIIGCSDDFRLQDARRPASKITEIDESAVDTSSDIEMRCSLPPHHEVLSFATYGDYEAHYNKSHMNRCAECCKNFPSEHLLNVHFEDCHDVFVAVKRDKGEYTYSCFVQGCDRKCRTPYKRRSHLIDKHMYPKNYFFALTKDGIDGRQSLLLDGGHRRRRPSTAALSSVVSQRKQTLQKGDAAKPHEDEQREAVQVGSLEMPEKASSREAPDTKMDDLASALSSLRFVPTAVRFGRGRGKAGFAKG